MNLNKFAFSLPDNLADELNKEWAAWKADDRIARIWRKDATLWTNSDESNWLGWLDVFEEESARLQQYQDLRRDIEDAGFRDVLLMGMGGSSLCPEVLAITFGKANFHILDSTVPAQIRSLEERLDLTRTLFIVASKSGSTLEPNCFKQYFFDKVSELVGEKNAGRQFIAITDPGSKMEEIARDDGFRHIFYGKADVGGRFSALSAFGLVAAAAMGLDLEGLLQSAAAMAKVCRIADPAQNPGALLGLIFGVCHRFGRDKLTILTAPEIYDFGAWLEQLIAESTGKNGVAIIPVDREPVAANYGDDRVFVNLSLADGTQGATDWDKLRAQGHPIIEIRIDDIYDLGGEFFRWEFATAAAGAVMGINPFNQPDVESAKIEARKITDRFESTGELPDETPFFEEDGVKLFASDDYAAELKAAAGDAGLAGYLTAHVANIGSGDYFAILAFVEMNTENEEILQNLRSEILKQRGAATCLGFGPRFLHSTGQAYKGGANNGVFLQITAKDEFDLPVPGQKYSFGVVKAAQARGDFQVLLDRDRRALRIDFSSGLSIAGGLIENIGNTPASEEARM